MRRRLLALALSIMAITVLAPAAGAEDPVEVGTEDPYICVRSRMLLGDPICISWYPPVN